MGVSALNAPLQISALTRIGENLVMAALGVRLSLKLIMNNRDAENNGGSGGRLPQLFVSMAPFKNCRLLSTHSPMNAVLDNLVHPGQSCSRPAFRLFVLLDVTSMLPEDDAM